jgi:hypothetical protein
MTSLTEYADSCSNHIRDAYGLCPQCNTDHGELLKGKVWYPAGEI